MHSLGQGGDTGSRSSSGQAEQEDSSQFDHSLRVCMQTLFNHYTVLSDCNMLAFAGVQGSSQTQTLTGAASWICCSQAPALREDAAIWFQYAEQTCRVLEAYVREAARGQATGTCSLIFHNPTGLGDAVMQLIDPTQQGLRGPLLQAAAAAGPGSKVQQQLHGLLLSAIKWAGLMGPEQQPLAEQLRAGVAVAAANMLLAASRVRDSGDAAAASAAAEVAGKGDMATSSTAASGSSHQEGYGPEQPAQYSTATQAVAPPGFKAQSAAAADVLPHLPFLGVLGCCCLQWSQQLASLPTDNLAAAAAAVAAAPESQPPHRAMGVITVLPAHLQNVWGTAVEAVFDDRSLIALCVEAAGAWLTGASTRQIDLLIQSVPAHHLEELSTAMFGSLSACNSVREVVLQHPDAPIPLAGYVQQLSALGEALCAVAHKQSCNNPTCGNVSGPSELQLVKGRSNTCSDCRTARYCSPECMRQHWKQHRPVCKALGRAAAKAADAAAVAAAPAADGGPPAGA
jgi:hypothetical protein